VDRCSVGKGCGLDQIQPQRRGQVPEVRQPVAQGITYRPVTGVSPSEVCVAWPPASEADPVLQDFVACCLESMR
jgi:hypothetical protein